MPLPDSRDKSLRNALADHLAARCLEIDPSLAVGFNWRETRNVISKSIAPGDDPQGTVILASAIPALNGASWQLSAHERSVLIQLVVAHENEEACQDLACDWQAAIATSPNSVMNQLRLAGISTSSLSNAFKGIEFISSSIEVELLQEGAIGTITMKYKFTDIGR